MTSILIVDDKEENNYYLQALLTGHGFVVDTARHGAEALVKARQSPPDLIISDLLMPVMDGYTLLRLWKADDRLKNIPFIVYTATYTEPEDERLALNLGADAFILKPTEPEDFLARVYQLRTRRTAASPASPPGPAGDDKELLKVYSQTLIRKLEEKTLQLEQTNLQLQRDLAERKKLEVELTLREQRLNAFFTNAPAGLVLLDKHLCYVQLNETVAHINGLPIKAHLGKSIREVLPKLAPQVEPLLQQVLATGKPLANVELSGETPAQPGVIRHWMESFFPILGKDGLPDGLGVIFVEITGRRQTEETLRLLNSAVLQAKESIVITDADLDWPGPRIIFVNPAFTQMTGYTAAEVIGHTPRILQGPGTDKAVLQRLRQSLERGEVFDGEAIQYRKDGTEYFQEWQIAPLQDADGKTTHFVAIQRDISERKRTEESLRVSEEKFFKIFQSSPMAMTLSSIEDGCYLDVNRQFLNILERSREEVLGHTALELGVWAKPEQRADYMTHFKEHGSLRNVELEIRGLAGKSSHILWSADLVVIGGQRCLLGSSLDITERRRAEEELRWKTAMLEAQIDSTLDGILVVDEQGRQILRNQRMIDLWKIPADIVQSNDNARQIKYAASRAKNPEEFMAKVTWLYAHPDEINREEIQLVDGTVLDRYSSPVRDRAGKHYGRIWTFRDITGQRNLEAQFRQSQKMEAFGQLAGGVAHDFNNILAVIQLQAGLIKLEQNLSLQQLDFASEIEASAQRAANLTRQLLLFSRQQTMLSHDLDLKEVVANIAKMLQRTLGEQVQLQFKFFEEPLFIHADAGMIDQILLNLAVNARDAMPKGGQIMIETSAVEFDEVNAAGTLSARPGSFACLSVTDTGTGIPPEIMPRIFEPFFTTKEVGRGTGLGLATIFGIVQQHKGWINVESNVGQGSTFRVYLPRLARMAEKKSLWAAPAAVRGGDETILLVEDESPLRDSIQTSLLRLGYRVLEASTGDEAWELWKQHRGQIQLLLTDMVMPGGMTGTELAAKLLRDNPRLKVIYTSGYSAEIAGKDFVLEHGVNFLAKPFRARELAEMIRNLLDPI
jgi:PAS domain S-box-containing protein